MGNAVEGEAAGPEYQKINTVWKRHPTTNRVLVGNYSTPELEYLAQTQWWWWEKVDGTNIRLHWNGWDRWLIGGKSNNAQIPGPLHEYLVSILPDIDASRDQFDGPATVYGEGYGAGIQKGGAYSDTPKFAVFDVLIEDWWLNWDNVTSISEKLGFETVPFLGQTTLMEAVRIVREDEGVSAYGEQVVREGLVGRPRVELHTRTGKRIIVKVKRKDYI